MFTQGSKGVVSALALSIRSVEVTWSYLFVWCSMPSLASSTAKDASIHDYTIKIDEFPLERADAVNASKYVKAEQEVKD